jgi:myo-inositol-1(or 4)-monophosphatase
MSEWGEDHALLIDTVRAAGALALDFFRGDVRHWEKEPGDPVSEADHAVNDLLEERLRDARPGYGWLSEESTDAPDRLDTDRLWVVDPIDGTRAFIRRRPEFTVSVALVEAERPVVGVVYNPATEEFFDAIAGGGACLNGEPIRVSAQPTLEGARLISGKRIFERAGWPAPPRGAHFATINSIAYRACLVAAGRHDACLSLTRKSDWDIAAAELIVAEAGGRATTSRGEGFIYNRPLPEHTSIITAGPALHGEIMRFLDAIERPPDAGW